VKADVATPRPATDRAWSASVGRERIARAYLRRLPAGWYLFHDVPIGSRGPGIDHVVVGPPGVFNVHAKHETRDVRVTPAAVFVGGRARDHLQLVRFDAGRTSALLSAAAGCPVSARSVLAMTVDRLVVEDQPPDVAAVHVGDVAAWLTSRPEIWAGEEVYSVARAAHRPDTWTAPIRPQAGDPCACGGDLVPRDDVPDRLPVLGCSGFPRCRRTRASHRH
jgi:Nuclease-related domain